MYAHVLNRERETGTDRETDRNQATTVHLNIQLVADLYLLLKMHVVSQNYSLSAEEVLRGSVDVLHYGSQAQMIHGGKKVTHACQLKTGISLNYYYREGNMCSLCTIK